MSRPELARRKHAGLDGVDEQPVVDERLDRITDKVLDFMDSTPAEEWSKEIWTVFKQVWQVRPKPKVNLLQGMTPEELKRMISDDPLSS